LYRGKILLGVYIERALIDSGGKKKGDGFLLTTIMGGEKKKKESSFYERQIQSVNIKE
jgi:hypothetical protein